MFECENPDKSPMYVLPSHVDDLDLIPVGELNDLLVEVEEDILTLTLAVQGLVGQTEMGSREKSITVYNPAKNFLPGIAWLLLSKTEPICVPDPLIHDRVVVESDGELLPLVRRESLLRVADEAEARVVHLAPAGARSDRRRAHRALAGSVRRAWKG